ncbi:MAG: efflux RND transporter periplasmic adaptor subunit [Phycisphaerae bacterium]|nr:efflux RND transporter periplasmic adaptor subunit [Tepidisphaeraceae bacterium]
MNKWIKRTIVVGLLAAAGYGGWAWYRSRSDDGAISFRTAPVASDKIRQTIGATGTIQPEETVDVGAQVRGQVLEFGKDVNGATVDNNSPVKEGQLLARIDDFLPASQVASAEAQLAQAKAGVTRAEADLEQMKAKQFQAKKEWDRAQKIGPSDALSQQEYDQIQYTFLAADAAVKVGDAAVTQAKAAVLGAESTLKSAKRDLEYCRIYAPVDGTVIARRVNIGQTVVSQLNAPSLFLLARDLTKLQIWASVNEADIGNIHEGQTATFTVDAHPGREFIGTVRKVRLFAQMTSNVVTYLAEITVDNTDGKLRPYLTANVQFVVAEREKALVIPNAALRYWPSSPDLVVPEARESLAQLTAGGRGGAGGAGAGGSGRREGKRPKDDAGAATRPAATLLSTQPTATTQPTTAPAVEHAGHRRGVLWLQAAGNLVRPVKVRVGITDGTSTEVIADELKATDTVVVGESKAGAQAAEDARNPFLPQFGGGRGSRSGGGGGGSGGGSRGAR